MLKLFSRTGSSPTDQSAKDSFVARLILLAVPIILQELINSTVNLLDTFMIGKLGIHEVTAVGLANQIFFLFILLTFGINSGSSIFMGQFWGKNDTKSIRKVMGICFISTFLGACLFAIPAFFVPEKIMSIYSDNDTRVIELGAQYLRIVCFSYFLTAFSATLNISLKSIGQTKIPMFTTMIALSCNFILNYIFIFILKMGVEGAAYATLIARFIELCVQLVLVNLLKLPVIGQIRQYFSADAAFIKKHFMLTYPVILNEFIWALGTSAYNIAYKFTGTEGQGAVQISGTIQNLFGVIGFSVGSAAGIILANTLGANEKEKAIRYSRKSLFLAVALSILMGLVLLLVAPGIISLFNVSDQVKEYAAKIMYVIAAGMVIKTFNFTSIVGILRSGGDTMFCLILDGLTVWLVGVPLAFIGGYFLRLPIYWVVLFVYGEEIVKLFASAYRVFSNIWVKNVVEDM